VKVQQIFTPNDTPTVTYVDRSEHKLEQTLRNHFETPNVVVSLSGPSKSGKTVLIKKVVAEDRLIPVIGAGIASADNLWERVLGWMGAPSEVVDTNMSSNELTTGGEAAAKAKVPLFAEGGASVSFEAGRSWGRQRSEIRRGGGLWQVIEEIRDSDFVVFIDDFHYIDPSIREEVGRQIKAAAENGVKIFTASVPHRSDDVVRSNSELRGRVAAVDLKYWSVAELVQIAQKGFRELNTELSPLVERKLATEAFGSPQLMQSICLNVCYVINLREVQLEQCRIDLTEEQITEILLATSSYTDFSKMVTALHAGPRTRGTERKVHQLADGTTGDVYRAVLLAVKENPAELSFSYDNILSRVRAVCVGEAPTGSSVTSALEQMNVIGEEVQPGTSPISWDGDTLDIADPYFLFFLRWSNKLAEVSR